jgi:DNA-binding NarL/FixJ family response regulator
LRADESSQSWLSSDNGSIGWPLLQLEFIIQVETAMFATPETDMPRSVAAARRTYAQPLRQPATSILIVDAHFLIRDALRGALKQMTGDVRVIEASGGQQAIRCVSEHSQIDLVLLELDLPDRDGLSVLAELRQSYPAIPVLVLSARHDCDSVMQTLAVGASGFIPKSAQREVMLSALELVLAGGVYIPPVILAPEGATLSRPNVTQVDARALTQAGLGLSGRQIEVLQLMMQGKSNKAICRALNLAVPTVKNHVTAIFKVLKVSSRTEAVIAVDNLSKGRQLGGSGRMPRAA